MVICPSQENYTLSTNVKVYREQLQRTGVLTPLRVPLGKVMNCQIVKKMTICPVPRQSTASHPSSVISVLDL
jgi:hypothetical protein